MRLPTLIMRLLGAAILSLVFVSGTVLAVGQNSNLVWRVLTVRPTSHLATVIVTTSIQSAIDAASPGDTVVIPGGHYTESLTLNKAVSLVGPAGPVDTIIQAVSGQRVLTVTGSSIDSSVVISGLTFVGGQLNLLNEFVCPNVCGGNIYITGNARPIVQYSVIQSGTARLGGGLYVEAGSPITLTHVRFEGNYGVYGGGALSYASLLVDQSVFINNVGYSGGGLRVNSGSTVIANSVFASNRALYNGAGLWWNSAGKVLLLNSTLFDAGLNPKEAIVVLAGTVGISNAIIASHTVGISHTAGTVYQDYNVFFGNVSNSVGAIINGSHSFNGDPRLRNPAGGDYHLMPGSMAIDIGANIGVSVDIDDQSRPLGSAVDIGADEADVPITGLGAVSSSPSLLGNVTAFTAAIAAGTNVQYEWEFGDGGLTHIGDSVQHVYSAIGTYTATVSALNSATGPITAMTKVTVLDVPISGLEVANTSPVLPKAQMHFTAVLSGGTNVNYQWNFGDGAIAVGPSAAHAYAAAGIYTAAVLATNGNSAPVIATTRVTVTTSIQQVINATPPGGMVEIPSGTYVGSLSLTKPVSLVGAGSRLTRVTASPGQRVITISGNSVDGSVVITGLTLSGGNLPGTSCPASCGGGVWLTDGASPVFVQTEIVSNSAYRGGGVWAEVDSSLVMTGVQIAGNAALTTGGGIDVAGVFTLSQVSMRGNTAVIGGGLYHNGNGGGRLVNTLLARNTASGSGAGLSLNSTGAVQVLHVTVADAGVNSTQAIDISAGTVNVSNTIVASHTTGIRLTAGVASQNYNLFFGTVTDLVGAVSSGPNSRTGNPAFIEPNLDDFHIGLSSAARNVGASLGVTTDLDGHMRPISNGYDMGAYEADLPVAGVVMTNSGSALVKTSVVFTAQATGGTNVVYYWNYGDGTVTEFSSVHVNPHVYQKVGTFTATVTATNNINLPVTATSSVTIQPLLTYLPLILNRYQRFPIAGLTLRNSSPAFAKRAVLFTSEVVTGTDISYEWNFGDGEGQWGMGIVTHTYAMPGQYRATVTATNGLGKPLTATTPVTISPSIQAMIDAAPDGSTVVIEPGTYHESLTLNKRVSLMGRDGALATIIEAEPGRRVLTVTGAMITNSVVISGLTFTGGDVSGQDCPVACGGGILITGTARPVLRNSIIAENRALKGGGLYVFNSSNNLVLMNVELLGNSAQAQGGGAYLQSTVYLRSLTVKGNGAAEGAGLYYSDTGGGDLLNMVMAHNSASQAAAGLAFNSTGNLKIIFSTIADRALNPREAVVATSGTVWLTNTIVANHAVGISATSALVSENYTLFYGNGLDRSGVNAGPNSRTGDPAFFNSAADDYHLSSQSAAINWGIAAGIWNDLDNDPRPLGGGYEVGADETDDPIGGLQVAAPASVYVGRVVTVTASITTGTNVLYQFDFGDGTRTSPQSAASITYAYSTAGMYLINVTATNRLNVPVVWSQLLTVQAYRVYLPLVLSKHGPLVNGGFELLPDWLGWQHGKAGFLGYGGTGLPSSIVFDVSRRARLGDPAYNGGKVPVGYAFASQSFTVLAARPYLRLNYRFRSLDSAFGAGTQQYYDTFEVALNAPPDSIVDAERNGLNCKATDLKNPPALLMPMAGTHLIFCGGAPVGNYTDFDSGWRTVTFDLRAFAGETVSLYVSTWNREYKAELVNDQGDLNTYADIDDVELSPAP